MAGFRLGGLRIKRKVPRVFKWLNRQRQNQTRLDQSSRTCNLISRIMVLVQNLGRGAMRTFSFSDPGYIQLGREGKRATIPKGHLAVYIGDGNGGSRRVVVPVMYFNHPSFEGLLKEAEQVYGFNQTGGLTLPCGYSEFEKVKTRIDAWDNSGHFWRQNKLVS